MPNPAPPRTGAPQIALVLTVFAVVAILLFAATPMAGDFAWSDAPRHALDGVFVHDMLSDGGWREARAYAIAYYTRLPALTILFYPPLFSVILAPIYALFGVSQATAMGAVIAFYGGLGVAMFFLARRWLGFGLALAAALLLVAAPELTFWGRQVMLDVPCYFWLVVSAICFVDYLDLGRPRTLFLALGFCLAALYTKQTPFFVVPAMAAGAFVARGPALFRQKHVWLAAILFAVLLLPLIAMQLKFGAVNVASIQGARQSDVGRGSLAAWTYYAGLMPLQLGWPTVVLALVYLGGCGLRPDWRLPRAHFAFLLSWLIAGYFYFSSIAVREPRHDLMVLMPLPIFAMLALDRLAKGAVRNRSVATAAFGLILALGTGAWALANRPVPYYSGYQEAASYASARTPPGGAVLFSGYRDGSFIFDMRALGRRDLSIVRYDKVALKVTIERERGVKDLGETHAAIKAYLKSHGIRLLVIEPEFWADLPSMAALQETLKDTANFHLERRIPVNSNLPEHEKALMIYSYTGPVDTPPQPVKLDIGS